MTQRRKRLLLLALCLGGMLLFGSLAVWQVQRLGWKRDLIDRVEARLHQPPVPLPPPDEWRSLDGRDIEYRRVQVEGTFLHAHETLVDALTGRGAGAWVLTPLDTGNYIVFVNRGFLPRALQDPRVRGETPPVGPVRVTGLLRLPEPAGRVLRPNDAAADRWFSRDTEAIARARGLEAVAPFFIDADAAAAWPGAPIGGMTVVHFRNAHLTYALTWLALAGLCGTGAVLLLRDRRRD